jgi:hypothetical protein
MAWLQQDLVSQLLVLACLTEFLGLPCCEVGAAASGGVWQQ